MVVISILKFHIMFFVLHIFPSFNIWTFWCQYCCFCYYIFSHCIMNITVRSMFHSSNSCWASVVGFQFLEPFLLLCFLKLNCDFVLWMGSGLGDRGLISGTFISVWMIFVCAILGWIPRLQQPSSVVAFWFVSMPICFWVFKFLAMLVWVML